MPSYASACRMFHGARSAFSNGCGRVAIKTISTCSNRFDRTPIKSGLMPQSQFQGFYIGHLVLRHPTRGGTQWILHGAFIVQLRGHCRHGLNQSTSLTTSLNSSEPDFTAL